MIEFPDISSNNTITDLGAALDAAPAIGFKIDEGLTFNDPTWVGIRNAARDRRIVRLMYHFGHPENRLSIDGAHQEAQAFEGRIGALEADEIAVLDQESNVAAGVDLSGWALTWLDDVDGWSGRSGTAKIPVTYPDGHVEWIDDTSELYSYGPYVSAHLRLIDPEHPLWLAAYSNNPTSPSPWKAWTFWQKTSDGTWPGIQGRVDINVFTGPIEALHALAGSPPVSMTALPRTIDSSEEHVHKAVIHATPGGTAAYFTGPFDGKTYPVPRGNVVGALPLGVTNWHIDPSPNVDGSANVHADPACDVELSFT